MLQFWWYLAVAYNQLEVILSPRKKLISDLNSERILDILVRRVSDNPPTKKSKFNKLINSSYQKSKKRLKPALNMASTSTPLY